MNKLLIAALVCFLLPFAILGSMFVFVNHQAVQQQATTTDAASPTQETLGDFGLFMKDYQNWLVIALLVAFCVGMLLAIRATGRPRRI
jgi:hypothetical protein